MRLGYLMPLSVDTVVTAHRLGYDVLEANIGWLDKPTLDTLEADLPAIQEKLDEREIGISAVAIYGGAVESPVDDVISYYERAMDLASSLDCDVVAGMTGRDNTLTIEENLPLFAERFDPIARMAGDRGIRIAFEPWPGHVTGYGPFRWTNMAVSPELYDRLFEAVSHPALGIEYDASHYIWQGIDHLHLFRDYADRIYHVHAKDIIIDWDRLKRTGIHGADWWRFVIPGLGQIDWPDLLNVLNAAGYTGDITVEHEDRTYMGNRWNEGLTLGLKTLRPLMEMG